MASGWELYDATKMDNLGFGVVTSLQTCRWAPGGLNGPTGARFSAQRPAPKESGLCAVRQSSRDENHLPYCSYICCMASEAGHLRAGKSPEAEFISYIDITPGRYEQFTGRSGR
jgi:quinone-modifying oxidoreductase subunit QmoA